MAEPAGAITGPGCVSCVFADALIGRALGADAGGAEAADVDGGAADVCVGCGIDGVVDGTV